MPTTKPSPRDDQAFKDIMNAMKSTDSTQVNKEQERDIATMLGSMRHTFNFRQQRKLVHNESMNIEQYPTHRELDAKLETIETRMDGRLARIEDKFNSIDKRFESIDGQFKEIKNTLEAQKNVAWKAAAATIAAMIATIIAVTALGFTAFDSGRDTAKMTSEAQFEISASVAEVRQMIQELRAQQEKILKTK